MTLHILINTDTARIVNATREIYLDSKNGLKKFIKFHTEQEGRPLARVIVKPGQPVKVIQAGEEEI